MGACQSKKAFKAALKKRRMEKLPKGQRSSSGVNNLSKRPSRSPSWRGSTPNSPSPSVTSSGNRKTPLKTAIKCFSPKKSLSTKNKIPGYLQAKSSPSNFHDRVLHKTSTVSPAPAPHPRLRNSSHLTRFGFKSRPSSLLTSGESSDSVNSILSDAQASSNSNLIEENGNRPNESENNGVTNSNQFLDNGIRSDRNSSPCTISEASSGVTSSAIGRGKLLAQSKQLPEPQTASVAAVKESKQRQMPSSIEFGMKSIPGDKGGVESSLVMPKLSVSRIPQTKSSLLKSQKTMRDLGSSNKSLNTLDSGLGSSSESDKIKLLDDTLSTKRNKPKDEPQSKNKIELDISDAWLKEKLITPMEMNKNRSSSRSINSEILNTTEKFKDTIIPYSIARQKIAPYRYSRNRFQNEEKLNTSKSSQNNNKLSKTSMSPSKFKNSGIVKSRIESYENTPSIRRNQSPAGKKVAPKKSAVRPTALEKTPIIVSSTPETNVELNRTVIRRLEYNEGKDLMLSKNKDKSPTKSNQTSPTIHDILMVPSYEVKKDCSSPDACESKRVRDLSESEKTSHRNLLENNISSVNCKSSPNESETSFEILESPETQFRNSFIDSKTENESVKIPSLPSKNTNNDSQELDLQSLNSFQELCIREETDEFCATVLPKLMTSSCSSKTSSMSDPFAETPRQNDSCGDRWSESGNCTPTLNSHRKEIDQDFLIDDEISDQPDLIIGDEDDLVDSLFEDQDLFINDPPSQTPPPFHYHDSLDSPFDVSTRIQISRSRHESQGTISSLGPDDLMLDYEVEDQKSSFGYEERVSTPATSQIYEEWMSMLDQVRDSSLCVSNDPGVGINSIACSIPNGGTISSQPSNGLDLHRPRIVSADLDTKKGVLFKPPRQAVSAEHENGINLDRTNFHYICQDLTAMKTLLFKLRRVLQVADTVNPFDQKQTSYYMNLCANDPACEDDCEASDAAQDNIDLKRQVVLLQQRLEEKDRSIHILQQQLAQALHANNTSRVMSRSLDSQQHRTTYSTISGVQLVPKVSSNAATQTDRSSHRPSSTLSTISRTDSEEDGLGPTVSFRLGKVHLF